MSDASFDVIVVGAGAVGACSALELVRSGAKVAVVERGEGWAAGCSWGNAGLIVPSHASPFAERRDLAKATGWLAKPDSPFGVDVSPALLPWMLRLVYECLNVRGARRATELLLSLAHDSAELHAAYSAEGLDTGYKRNGLLDVYQTDGAFRRARKELSAHASSSEPLSASEARAAEPLLSGQLAGAVINPNEAQCDPGRFVPAIGGAAVAAGAQLVTGFRVTGLSSRPGEVRVRSDGSELSATNVVLATGARTPEFAPNVPVVSGTGCSIDLTEVEALPTRPMILREARLAITPFDDRLRFAGTMLLARTPPDKVDPRRIEGIYRAGTDALPSIRTAKRSSGWIGARPCTPDGVPRVGWVGAERPNVAVAAGHAMHGLAMSPITGRLVRGLIEGHPDPRLAGLSPNGNRR
jgi:D-amino-acid dehydrogenase